MLVQRNLDVLHQKVRTGLQEVRHPLVHTKQHQEVHQEAMLQEVHQVEVQEVLLREVAQEKTNKFTSCFKVIFIYADSQNIL